MPPHHEDDGDSIMSLHRGLLLSCLGRFHALQARRHNSHNRMHPSNCYSRPLCAVWHRPTGNCGAAFTARRSVLNNSQTSDTVSITTSPPALSQQLHSIITASVVQALRSSWRTANRVRSGQAATSAAKQWCHRFSNNCMCSQWICSIVIV